VQQQQQQKQQQINYSNKNNTTETFQVLNSNVVNVVSSFCHYHMFFHVPRTAVMARVSANIRARSTHVPMNNIFYYSPHETIFKPHKHNLTRWSYDIYIFFHKYKYISQNIFVSCLNSVSR